MVGVAQLVEPRIVIPVVVGSSPIVHPIAYFGKLNVMIRHGRDNARVAKLVYALDLGSSGATRESSSLSSRTNSKDRKVGYGSSQSKKN